MKFNIQKKSFFIVLSILIFGSILRVYNINFNDFWSDEMVSYFISDPSLSLIESFKLIFKSNLMVTFELILKYYHYLFGYDIHISRYLSVFFNISSLILFYNFIKKNKNKESAILGTTLLAINIYHIKYAIELRSYSLTFFLVLIILNLIFAKGKIKNQFNFIEYILIFIASLSMLFSHAYSIILLISINSFILLSFLKKKLFQKELLIIFLIFFLSSILFLFFYIINISHYPSWIQPLKNSFFTNYFFSTYFGSRMLGMIHLLILIFLIIKFFKKSYQKLDLNFFLILFLFFSYFIPIIYSYFFSPALIDRYIFFVIIPILYLISTLTISIEKIKLKFFFLILLLVANFLNHFTENTFKQFYTEIYPSKPEIKKTLLNIKNSEYNKYSIIKVENNPYNINFVYENYFRNYTKKINDNLYYIDYLDDLNLPDTFWLIYITDITNKKFQKPIRLKNYQVSDIKIFNHIESYLLKKNGFK